MRGKTLKLLRTIARLTNSDIEKLKSVYATLNHKEKRSLTHEQPTRHNPDQPAR